MTMGCVCLRLQREVNFLCLERVMLAPCWHRPQPTNGRRCCCWRRRPALPPPPRRPPPRSMPPPTPPTPMVSTKFFHSNLFGAKMQIPNNSCAFKIVFAGVAEINLLFSLQLDLLERPLSRKMCCGIKLAGCLLLWSKSRLEKRKLAEAANAFA